MLAWVMELLKSKTIWGLIILLFNMVLKGAPITDVISEELHAAVTAIADGVGAMIIVWGRITAKGPLLK